MDIDETYGNKSVSWSHAGLLGWIMLPQTVLSGKVQRTYAALSAEDCADYDIVKMAILKNYKLVSEAYRQRFRSHRKGEGRSYQEFIKDKEGQFHRWCNSNNIREKYKLKQLILMEEFINCFSRELKVYLGKRKLETGYEMAASADVYTITYEKERRCDLVGQASIKSRQNLHSNA